MGLMDGPLEIGPAHGPLGLTGLAGLLRSLLGTGAEANVRVKCATCGYVKSDPAPAYVVKGVSAGCYVAGKLRCPGCPSVDGKNPERFFKPYDSRLAFVSRDDLFREARRTSSQAIR